MELIMSDWEKERDDFLAKIGQVPAVKPTPKPTKKDEE